MQPQSLSSENWNLLKFLFYSKRFYPDFDPDNEILEQSLLLTTDKDLLFMFYLNKLLGSMDGFELVTSDIEFSMPVISFSLTSIPGEYVYDLIDLNFLYISKEIEDCSYCDDVCDAEDSMCFYLSLYEDHCPGTYNVINSIFEKELFTVLEGYVYVQFLKNKEVTIYISLDIADLVPDSVEDMVPIEEFIRFRC